ncbi:CopG family transcriptional regulator [Microcoleus sp. N9_B4]|uniref:CopG family transcriptional regulator n=1 Tax=Microcoleus sp. N9_B4 TaxID=3055386 RepID=UPI002FD5F6BD
MTQAEKISISLPRSLAQFIESYKIAKGCESDSQVIEVALKLLRRLELESAYREASLENDPGWEATVADGLTDETW